MRLFGLLKLLTQIVKALHHLPLHKVLLLLFLRLLVEPSLESSLTPIVLRIFVVNLLPVVLTGAD